MTERILFIYNADSGLFNTLTDIAHKLISPSTYQCDLCSITHGIFKERDQWRSFIETLPFEVLFFHRDEFGAQYDVDNLNIEFPCLLREQEDRLSLLLSASDIASCDSVECLSKLIRNKLIS